MRGWVRIGVIGAGLYVAMALLSYAAYIVPSNVATIITYALCFPHLVVGVGIGVMAALLSPAPSTIARASVEGVLAGILAFAVSSCVCLVLYAGFSLVTGIPQRYLEQTMLAGESQWLSNPVAQIALWTCAAVIGPISVSLLGWLGGIAGYALRKRREIS